MEAVLLALGGVVVGFLLDSLGQNLAWRRQIALEARLVLMGSVDVIWKDYPAIRHHETRLRVHLTSLSIEPQRIDAVTKAIQVCYRSHQESLGHGLDESGIAKSLIQHLEEALAAIDDELRQAARPRVARRGPRALPQPPSGYRKHFAP